MAQEKSKHKKRTFKGWRMAAFAALVLLLLLVSGRLLLKSDWLMDQVRSSIVQQANLQLNGTLAIEQIRGDLLKELRIRNIVLHDSSKAEIATIDSISLHYGLMSVLFSPHTIDSLKVHGTNLHVEEQPDSTWNILNVLAESDQTSEQPSTFYWYVDNFTLSESAVEVRSPQYLPDSPLSLDEINLGLSVGMLENGFSANLRDLNFVLRDGKLPEPVNVYLAGAAQQNRYTLDSIVINTGRTVLRGSGRYEEDGEIVQQTEASPLSWHDLAQYTAGTPIEQNLQIELGVRGTLENLQLNLDASAIGLGALHVQAGGSLSDELRLHSLTIDVEDLNAPELTGLENTPVLRSLRMTSEGSIPLGSPNLSDWQGSLNIGSVAYETYRMDSLSADYWYNNGDFNVDGKLEYENQQVVVRADIDSIFGNLPGWDFQLNAQGIDPGVWLQDASYAGNLNININAIGECFTAEEFTSSADILVSGEEFYGQEFSDLSFSGEINHNSVEGFLKGQIKASRVDMEFNILDWRTNPEYDFNLQLLRFDLAEFNGFQDFPTFINGTIAGSGQSFNPEEMRLTATANFDSSIVNAERIQELNTSLRIENQFMIIDQGSINSPIADASFTLDHHLWDLRNSANRLNFNATIKDLQPLAPLFSVERLQSEGTINGNLGRNADGTLQFNSELNLENVEVDTVFNAKQMTGALVSYILEDPELDLNVELKEPSVYSTSVQDIQLYLYAKKYDLRTDGNLRLGILNGNNSSIRHSGTFSVDSTQTTLITDQLMFRTQFRELILEEPFQARYSDQRIEIDSLTISTDDGEAYLEFWAPRIDSLHQEVSVNAQNLNIGVLQETILKESYFDGYLNASLSLLNTDNNLEASLRGDMRQLKLNGGEMDSLSVAMDIKNEWLTGSLESWHDNRRIVDGSARAPFIRGDPNTFDEEFFERSVNGYFNIAESRLEYWLSFLPEGIPEQTGGTVVFESNLSGIAGNPDIEGDLTITEGLFSGIRVNSVGMDFEYLHQNEHIDAAGTIVRDGREILDFNAMIPFLLDLRRGEVNIPTGDDELLVDLITNNFDLALFNSYVDRELIRGLSGRLEGDVTLSGPMNNLQAEGRMQLLNGSMRIVPAGITISEVSSDLLFQREVIQLQQFSARSGPGRVRANGSIRMESLEPQDVDISVRANQFSLFNTNDYRAVINLNSRVSGDITAPKLDGSLTFLNGFYYLQDFGEKSVEAVELENPEEQDFSNEFFNDLEMEMTVAFNRGFFIRNRQYLDIQLELGGQVDLIKKPDQDMEIFGTLEGVGGYARPLGKEFRFEEAMVSFFGPMENPELQIRSRYSPPQAAGVQIYYIIDGTLEEPEFRFESQPEMELQDIMSYTLFGRPFYELESWEQVISGNSNSPTAADYALEVVLDRVGMLASQKLGIDVVEIDNSQSGSNNTVIKTGWYLNQSTFFAILNEIDGTSPKTLFTLEIMLKENLQLIITQGDDTRQGIDLQWEKDY